MRINDENLLACLRSSIALILVFLNAAAANCTSKAALSGKIERRSPAFACVSHSFFVLLSLLYRTYRAIDTAI